MYFVYLLKSLKDGKYYIGQTNKVQRRFQEHNNGKSIATKNRRPFSLIGYEIQPNQKEARFREYQLKKHSDKKKEFINKLNAKLKNDADAKKNNQ